jgi:hypothetical protein
MGNARSALATPRDELLHKQDPPADAKKWTSRAKGLALKVTVALSTQSKKGAWLSDDLIDAGDFVRNIRVMSDYVEAAKKGGAAFEALRTAKPKQ